MLTVGTTGAALFFASVIGVTLTASDHHPLNLALAARWLRWCGRYSYAAYVFHMTVIELLRADFGWNASPSRATGGFWTSVGFTSIVSAVSFGAAWLSWHLWERHFIALKRFFPSSSRVVRLVDRARVPVKGANTRSGIGPSKGDR